MSSNTDILALLNTEADEAVDQIILDSRRLHLIVNGTATEQAVTEDGSLIPTVRKAIVDNFYFKTPPLPWRNGGSVIEFNQLYAFTDSNSNVTWWYAPGATTSNPVVMRDSPINDGKFRPFFDKGNIQETYAPLLSPVFRGNPTVPLPPEGDSSLTIAPTAWVSREIEKVRGEVLEESKGEFQNITVRQDAGLNNLYVSGETIFTGDRIAALDAELSLRRLRMTGQTAEIAFEQNGTPPVATVNKKTSIKPFEITTGKFTSNTVTADEIQVGSTSVATDSLNVDGYMRGDYLHLEGNANNAADRPQLVVNGIAEIKTLRVIDTIEGLKADVEGLDIHPNSIVVERTANIKGATTLNSTLGVTGKTTLQDVEIKGTLTGAGLGVDGKDISPRNVTASSLNVSGNVTISGETVATGDVSVNNLRVNGSLTGNIDFSDSDLDFKNINVSEKATIKDLVVTGTVTGISGASVDGEDITPASVTTTGNISVGSSLNVAGDLVVGGELTLPSIDTGEITASDIDGSSLTVSGDITAGTNSTTTVNNLVVTGTTTGINVTANVDGQDILPSTVGTTTVTASGAVSAGSLSVTGDTSVNNLNITGTVTGLTIDLSEQAVEVDSIVAARTSTFADIRTNNIANAENIVTQNLQILGSLTDVNGDGFFANVTGQDILPNSVQSATSVRTKTLRVEETSRLEGLATFENGITVTGGDITSAQGKATFNDVQVNGSLTDSSGNAIGSVESIAGRDISPRSVTAQVSVTTAALDVTAQASAGSLIVTGESTMGRISSTGVSNFEDIRVGPLTADKITTGNVEITRTIGSTNPALTVNGPTECRGDLNVTGIITGSIDLASKDIAVANLTSTGSVSGQSMSVTNGITAASGTFGQDYPDAPAYGISSLSGANFAKNVRVGGNLTVVGNISGNVDLSGKALTPESVSATGNISGVSGTFTDLTVTGTLTLPAASSYSASTFTATGTVTGSKFATTPKDATTSGSAFIPDGTTSIYNVTAINDTEVRAPVGLLTSGKGESIFLFIEQDSIGGHAITFSSDFVVHGTETVNTDPNAVTVVNMVYRGKGALIDVFITRR